MRQETESQKAELQIFLSKKEALNFLFRENRIKLAFLFGSMIDGHVPRDVDIAVLFSHYSFDTYLVVHEGLCQALGRRDIDLVVLNRANAAIRLQAILNGFLLFAENEQTFANFVTDTLFEYQDYRRFKQEYAQHFKERSSEGLSMSERKLNRERIEAHLSALDEAVGRLKELRGRFSSFTEFKGDVDNRELCVHYLRIALESVLDICRHFLAVVGVSLTEIDTKNLIELAGEKGLIENAFARRIKGMAGMRNAIVHVYWRLDYEAIYRAITQELGDFDEFARQVEAFLDKEASEA